MGTPNDVVGRNVAELRHLRRISVRALSQRMGELGVPLLPSGITKTENGSRAANVNELMAFAVALGVTPNRLLLPTGDLRNEWVELTPETRVSGIEAWLWGDGVYPLGDGDLFDFEQHVRPPELHLRERHTAMRAARDVVSRVDGLLAAVDDSEMRGNRAKALRRVLERLVAEVNDLVESIDEQESDDAGR